MKNPLTPVGIEPATFRFAAQHLNHCATAFSFHVQYPLLLSEMKIEISDQTFEKYPNFIKFLSVGVHLFHAVAQTGRHDEVNNRFSQLCERA